MPSRVLAALALALSLGAAGAITACASPADEDVGSDEGAVRTAGAGATCGNGVFGTPKIDCATGLECVYPESGTAPVGPQGSSSASTGTCEKRAQAGETCGNGVFGTPKIDCASGLECVYPESGTAPTGPQGSSSASTGTCEKRAKAGEACGNGVFGTPKIACASGLECVYPASGTAPAGPAGSSSASMGSCEKRAALGERCGDGVRGTNFPLCVSGLVCEIPRVFGPPPSAEALANLSGQCFEPRATAD